MMLEQVRAKREVLHSSLGRSAGGDVCIHVARCGDSVDIFDLFAILIHDDAAAAVGGWDAVARGAEVENLHGILATVSLRGRDVKGSLPQCTSGCYAAQQQRSGAHRNAPARLQRAR